MELEKERRHLQRELAIASKMGREARFGAESALWRCPVGCDNIMLVDCTGLALAKPKLRRDKLLCWPRHVSHQRMCWQLFLRKASNSELKLSS